MILIFLFAKWLTSWCYKFQFFQHRLHLFTFEKHFEFFLIFSIQIRFKFGIIITETLTIATLALIYIFFFFDMSVEPTFKKFNFIIIKVIEKQLLMTSILRFSVIVVIL